MADNLQPILDAPAPEDLATAFANWPDRDRYTRSPSDWRDQVFYFLLPDRFANGTETGDRLLRHTDVARARDKRNRDWNWGAWCESGATRFQGGTIKGITSKLDYLHDLGATTLWIGPVWRQRLEEDTYHGYGIQHFLDIDPRFGSRRDLVELVDQAHQRGLYVICDIIFNHSGTNWLYDPATGNAWEPAFLKPGNAYSPIYPRSVEGHPLPIPSPDFVDGDYVRPRELMGEEHYLRAGTGSLGKGLVTDPLAEHKRSDFMNLRKFNLFNPETLHALIHCYQYWIALADIDGYRIDTFKHVSFHQASTFCNSIKEYAEVLGKDHFFLVAEVAGGDDAESTYLNATGRNLDATLDIADQRVNLGQVARGRMDPGAFFYGFDDHESMGSHRNWGSRSLTMFDDHDQVSGPKIRYGADMDNPHQTTAAMAFLLYTLGIPCIYYGTEQGLAGGAEPDQRQYLAQEWGTADWMLRETMFGPAHPRAAGLAGSREGAVDESLPGYGPHGTAGWHVFDPEHPLYQRIGRMTLARRRFHPLHRGRQYRRETSFLSRPFALHGAGEIVAWSRVFDDQEVLVVVNTNGHQARGALVLVDEDLTRAPMTVILNTADQPTAGFAEGDRVAVSEDGQGRAWVEILALGPSEVLLLANESAIAEPKVHHHPSHV